MEDIESAKKVAFDLANFYEHQYGCCSQSVLGALKCTVGSQISDDTFKSSTGLGAGLAGAGYACGALTGGIMALSCFMGREFQDLPDPEGIRFQTFQLARRLVRRFEEEYGENGGDCSAILTKLMGRSYDILNGERDAFIKAGGHDTICPVVCGKAAEWVVEILNEEKLI